MQRWAHRELGPSQRIEQDIGRLQVHVSAAVAQCHSVKDDVRLFIADSDEASRSRPGVVAFEAYQCTQERGLQVVTADHNMSLHAGLQHRKECQARKQHMQALAART